MSDALAAALMMQAQQGRGNDTYSKTRRMGEMLMAQGSQNRPTRHWMEDVNNNAQKLIGGFLMGRADDEQKSLQAATVDKYARALGAKDEASRMAILQEGGGDPQAMIPLMGALLSGKMADERKATLGKQAAGVFTSAFGGTPATTSAPTALAPPQQGAAPPDQAGFISMITPHALKVAQETGLDPRLVIAQTALETGYGNAAPGNNYFGIKGPGQTLGTQEAGPDGKLVPTQASFRTYKDPGESAADYANLLKNNSRYAPVLQAKGLDGQIDAMAKSGYATDPNYGAKLRQIASSLPPMDGAAPQAPGVTVQAQPQAPQMPAVPQVPRPQPTPDETARYAGLVQTGQLTVAQAKTALDADIDRRWGVEREQASKGFDVARDTAKTADERAYTEQRDKNKALAPSQQESADLRTGRADAIGIVSALSDFKKEFGKAGLWDSAKSLAGATTPMNTAYNKAALLAKGKALFDLGVLNGPDLDIIRRTLPDPSTFKGAATDAASMNDAVDQVIDLVQTRVAAKERQLGMTPTDIRKETEATTGKKQEGPVKLGANGEGYDQVKPGEQYVGPDGQMRVKGGG